MADDPIDPQRPVWNEQWCPPKDSVGPSEGKEDQFWATGFFEPLPSPFLPLRHSRPLHLADHEVPRRSQSNKPLPIPGSSISARKGHLRMEYADILPTSFRRKTISNLSPLRERHPRPLPISKMRSMSEGDRISATRSAGSSSSMFPVRDNRRIHIGDKASLFSGEWSQLKASSGSSTNHEYDIEHDPLLFSSHLSPHMPLMTPSYLTHTNGDIARSSSALLQSTGSKSHSHLLKKPSHSALHVKESEQVGSYLGAENASFEKFWSHALREGHGSSSSLDGQPSQQMGQFPTTVHPAQPLSSPYMYDSMAAPAEVQDSASAFGQCVRPSLHGSVAPLSSRRTTLLDFNTDIYGSPTNFQVAHQSPDVDFPQTLPTLEWLSQASFPDIIEDENGVFHCVE